MDEILKLHDLRRDVHGGSFEDFKKRSLDNLKNRSLHHYVFDIELLLRIVNFIEMEPLLNYSSPADHFIAAVK